MVLAGKHKVLDPALCGREGGRSVPGLSPEIYVTFFITHLSSHDNIFETET